MSNTNTVPITNSINTNTSNVQPHNIKAQSVWNSPAGRYDDISRSIGDAIEHAVERLQPKPGERILDLATGTGWGSRVIAQRFPGVQVIGADIADQMLDHARRTAAKLGLDIEYRHADAEKLPFEDGSFDGVISTFGVMFAGKPEAAAAELARVVRKGGRVVLSTWRNDSNLFHMFAVMKKFMPPPPQPPPPSPFEWGKRERLNQLLGGAFDLEIEEGTNHFRYASGEQAWNLWANHYGPSRSLAANLDEARREEFRRAMIDWHETFRGELGYDQPRQYLITRATRR
jgi:ubiquinone/menaquinone biosynthesis C-methylase UbiE